MHGKPGRVDSQLYELAPTDVLLQDRVRDLETVGILGIHRDAVDQGVAIGESLSLKAFFEDAHAST